MLKLNVLILVSMISLNVHAEQTNPLTDCQVIEVFDTSYFEESLSVEEYPDVSVDVAANGTMEVWIGSSLFRQSEGDQIVSIISHGFNKGYEITPSHQLEQFVISYDQRPAIQNGVLQGRRRDSPSQSYGEYEDIATLSCKN